LAQQQMEGIQMQQQVQQGLHATQTGEMGVSEKQMALQQQQEQMNNPDASHQAQMQQSDELHSQKMSQSNDTHQLSIKQKLEQAKVAQKKTPPPASKKGK